jgi:hypothetical protein
MTLQTIPAAATAIKEMLAADQAASSQQIDDIISRYLRVRDSAAVEPIENELAAIFASGVDHAARVVAGLELLPRTPNGMRASPQQEPRVFKNPAVPRIRAAFRNNRPQRFADRIGVPVKP